MFSGCLNSTTPTISINNPEELSIFIKEYVENKTKMIELQMKINYLLKIVRAHRYESRFSHY